MIRDETNEVMKKLLNSLKNSVNVAIKFIQNKITRSSIIKHLLLKVKISYTQYFAKNPIGIIRL